MRCVLAICAVFKDEAAYLREWVECHQLMGVEKFFLYNNHSSDRYLDALQAYMLAGSVVVHEWPRHPAQLEAYAHCLATHGADADWIAFLDIDEFLFAPDARRLPDVLADYAEYPAVGVNWVMFGSGGHVEKPQGGVLENFLRRGELDDGLPYPHLRLPDGSYRSENTHVKSIVQPSKVIACGNAHHFRYRDGTLAVDENKQPIEGSFSSKVSVARLRINHYWSKSESECRHKFGRGFADGGGARDWNEFLAHEQILNRVHDDTVLRVVAQLGTLPPHWALEQFMQDAEGVWQLPVRRRQTHAALHPTAMRLFELLRNAADTRLFAPALVREIDNRDSALQLSPRRANLLQALAGVPQHARVLEIGAGGGVLSQAWLERGCQVDAIECAPHWARVAAARMHAHAGARVFAASLRELAWQPTYDLVVLALTLDYAEAWPDTQPVAEAIAQAATALKPDGTLLVLADNRLAHADRPELPTLAELKTALHAAGLSSIETRLAFPDVWLPELLVHENADALAPAL